MDQARSGRVVAVRDRYNRVLLLLFVWGCIIIGLIVLRLTGRI